MSASVLVTYASRYGSTQEVAEAVAAVLRARGLEAELRPMREVRTLDGYGAVVCGAPLYIGALHKDARRFLTTHAQVLRKGAAGGPRIAVFALGPMGHPPQEEEWSACRAQLDAALGQVSGLAPVAVELFGGKYDPARLRLLDRLLAALPASPLHGLPASDARDWPAIRAWAAELAAQLGPAPAR